MIVFYKHLLPLLDRRVKKLTCFAVLVMMCLALLEALALIMLVPLMQLLTSSNLSSNSQAVTAAGDLFGTSSSSDLALLLGVLVLCTYVVKSIAAVFASRWVTTLALEQEALTVKQLMHVYLHAPYQLHLERNSAEMVRTITNSCGKIYREAFVSTLTVLGDFLSMILIGVILALTNLWLAIAVAVYFALLTRGYQRIEHRLLNKATRLLHAEQAEEYRSISQSFAAVKAVKVRNVESYFANEVFDRREKMIPAYRTVLLTAVVPRYILELAMFGAAAIIAGVAFSTDTVAGATATIGVFLAGGFRLLSPLNKVVFAVSANRSALPSVEQVADDLTQIPADSPEMAWGTSGEERAHVDGLSPSISVDDVAFSYLPGVPVLQEVSFDIEVGQSIGLVGGSGAGKSTLVDMLLGVLPPDSGEIRIGGHPLTEVRRQWQQMIGYVPQSVVLFDDTVRANIAIGQPRDEVDDDRMWAVLEQSQLAEVVRELPDGLDNVIGEAGVQLSGGQRQRLGVARALYPSPQVVMFDEATSALDNETEFKLTEVLEGLRGSITTITIAHRLSTVRRCDRIFYLEHGRLLATARSPSSTPRSRASRGWSSWERSGSDPPRLHHAAGTGAQDLLRSDGSDRDVGVLDQDPDLAQHGDELLGRAPVRGRQDREVAVADAQPTRRAAGALALQAPHVAPEDLESLVGECFQARDVDRRTGADGDRGLAQLLVDQVDAGVPISGGDRRTIVARRREQRVDRDAVQLREPHEARHRDRAVAALVRAQDRGLELALRTFRHLAQ